MPNGRNSGRRRGRRPKRRSDEKGGRTVQTAAPALFAFRGPVSSSVGLSAWSWVCAVLRCGSRCFRSGQRKAIIRTHHRLEIGSDYIGLVRAWGLEPQRITAREPKSRMSTNSIMPAWMSGRQRHRARQPLGTEKTEMHSINFILAFAVKKVNCTTGQKLV